VPPTRADLVLTGEGRLDAQSASGKTAFGVAQIATAEGVPAICIPGQAAPDAPRDIFAAVYPLVGPSPEGEITVAAALADPKRYLRLRAAEAIDALQRNAR